MLINSKQTVGVALLSSLMFLGSLVHAEGLLLGRGTLPGKQITINVLIQESGSTKLIEGATVVIQATYKKGAIGYVEKSGTTGKDGTVNIDMPKSDEDVAWV